MTNPSADVTCTKDRPWDGKPLTARVIHPDARELRQRDGYPGGDLVDMHCPNCGHRWTEELPQ